MPDPDRAIARVARRQLGQFARSQALDAGLSYRQVRHRVAAGLWQAPYDSVFRYAGAPNTYDSRVMAATLALPGSVASHETAANLWRWGRFPKQPIHLTRAHGLTHHPADVRLHQSRRLPPHHCTTIGPVPVATRARTVFDLAAVMPRERLGPLVDGLITARSLRLGQLATVFGDLAEPGRAGTDRIATVLDARLGAAAPTPSVLEDRFDELCDRAHLPRGVPEFPAPWSAGIRHAERVDRAHPDERLIIELDGRAYHSQLAAFENDRRRDQLAIAHGWRTVRFTWLQIVNDPAHVEWVLRSVLAPGAPTMEP